MRDDLDRRAIATLSAGHGGVDFASGAIPALIPFLVAEFDLDYVAAGGLMLAVTASSSLVQPLFGLWSDRRGALWLLPGGLALAALGTGLVANLWLVDYVRRHRYDLFVVYRVVTAIAILVLIATGVRSATF